MQSAQSVQSAQDNHAFESSLRDQLLIAAQNGQPPPATQQPTAQPALQYPHPSTLPQQQQQQQQQHQHQHQQPSQQQQRSSPHDRAHPLDPSIGSSLGGTHVSPYAMPQADGTSDQSGAGAASKKPRELSQSKRAAQNRAAQRAFRQRKEEYITKLEDEAKKFEAREAEFAAALEENSSLRIYIMELQGRLSEANIDFPAAPPRVHVAPVNPVVYDLSDRSPASHTARAAPANPAAYGMASHSPEAGHSHVAYPSETSANPQPYYSDAGRHYQGPQHADRGPPSANYARPQDELQQEPAPQTPARDKHSQQQVQHEISQEPVTDYATHQANSPHPEAGSSHDDALTLSAVNQLRAAAVQAGDQLESVHSPPSHDSPDETSPRKERLRPNKRQRLDDEGNKGPAVEAT